jgi:FkbM family methyltransferase
MNELRLVPSLFAHTKLRHWLRLACYLAGTRLQRWFGVELFREMNLRFKTLTVCADVQGRSGLAFLNEICFRRIYDAMPIRPEFQTLFDVGANCGFYAISRCLNHPHLRAVCFEPQPQTFARIGKNAAANGLAGRVRAVHAAVGARSSECELHVSAASSMGIVATSATQFLDNPATVRVRMLALDDFAATEGLRPDVLKIDVEGFEVEVIKGAAACLAHAQAVALEFHTPDLQRQCRELLARAGFEVSATRDLMFAHKPE